MSATDSATASLLGMGFDSVLVPQALQISKGDLDGAINWYFRLKVVVVLSLVVYRLRVCPFTEC